VPVQAVAGAVGRPAVWVWDGRAAVERPVELGATNDRFVAVLVGLKEGERVLLAPPRGARDGASRPGDPRGAGNAPAGGRGGAPRTGRSGARGPSGGAAGPEPAAR
jgi:hypothetical protein